MANASSHRTPTGYLSPPAPEAKPEAVLASLSLSRPPDAPRRPWYHWRRWGLNFLTLSILAHLFFGFLATYFIVQNIHAQRKQTFAGSQSSPGEPTRAMEHKVQMQKKKQTMSAPAATKRITTASNMKVNLPAMPAMPAMNGVTPITMAGMGGTGIGLGMSRGSAGAAGGGNGVSQTLFGFHGNGNGLEGTFYDYKMDQTYKPIPGIDTNAFAHIVHDVLPTGGDWHPESPYKHFTSLAKLHSKFFMYPAIQDVEAGAAFLSPRSGPGSWLAVYRGAFASPDTASFRFVGFGDNVMIVKVGSQIVLDASDHGYTGLHREALGNVRFPGKDVTPLFGGKWLDLSAGEFQDIEIAVGDEGGIFCSGLFIQPRDTTYAQGDNGIPKLPVFILGTPTDDDRTLLGKYLPAECLQGPFFRAQASSSASIFSH